MNEINFIFIYILCIYTYIYIYTIKILETFFEFNFIKRAKNLMKFNDTRVFIIKYLIIYCFYNLISIISSVKNLYYN